MIMLLSPSKKMNFKGFHENIQFTLPLFLNESGQLISTVRKLSPNQIKRLMGISNDLAIENFNRFQNWVPEHTFSNAKQAIFAYKGDVYVGLNSSSFSLKDLDFAQKHLRILSGLYGVLRPLDLIQPYRLEMGIPLKIGKNKNLYEFWHAKLTAQLLTEPEIQKDKLLINLASVEYFAVMNTVKPDFHIVTPVFKDYHNGKYRILQFFMKKARGMMASFIILNSLKNVEEIKHFDTGGYYYNHEMSNENEYVFTRDSLK